jgi:hypothetical protein
MSSDTFLSSACIPALNGQVQANETEGDVEQTPNRAKFLSEILEGIRTRNEVSDQQQATKHDVQTLYEGPAKCRCCTNWVDVYPDDLKSSIEQEAVSKTKALVIRLGKNHSEGKPLALDSIVVQNQQIKELLSQVFHGYRGITAKLKKLVLRAPFRPFFYRWTLFKRLVEEQKATNHDASPFSQLLYDILYCELRETMDEIEDLCRNGVVTYELLWGVFHPGTRLYSSIHGQDRFFLLESSSYQEGQCPCFGITAKYVDWDGESFGFATETLNIQPFDGTMKINELSIYPAAYHKSETEVAGALKLRGEAFYGLRGMQYKAYAGEMLYNDGYSPTRKVSRTSLSSLNISLCIH